MEITIWSSYDEVVDAMIVEYKNCAHKSAVQTDAYGNWRYSNCTHKPEECEYKRLLLIEAKLNGGFSWAK